MFNDGMTGILPVANVNGDGGNDWGNDWLALIDILALFGWGGNGFGAGNCGALPRGDLCAAMQNQLNQANLAASQVAQNQYLVDQLRPCPTPAYITCNPWATNGTTYSGCNTYGNCCGC